MPASPQHLALTLALLSTSCLSPVAFAKAALLSTASTDSLTLNGNDTLTLTPSGSLTTTKVAVTLKDDTRGSGVVIDNAGSLISTGGRAIDTSGSTRGERNYSIINRSGATIQGSNDALRIDTNFTSGSVLIDNSGTVRSTGSGQAIDLDSLRSEGVQTTLINREGGLIRGEFSDGMKTGSNATILNYGEISSGDALTDDNKFDGIDIDSATGVTVTNHGTLSGGRHGMTTDLGATLVNYGEVTGRNGSGFGSDGNGTVINYGTITGAYSGLKPNGDGDGVDIDLIAHIENYGVIQGTGAGGVDKNGFANGYRRLEWKCNNDNARSKRTAVRLGYTYEGVFRQHMVVKGKNRDTTWYSIISTEWPAVAVGFEKWLALDNQPESGQIKTLEECRGKAV